MDSIGEHSLMSRLHGEFKAISEQHPTQKDPDFWKAYFKLLACEFDDYPMDRYRTKRKGKEVVTSIPRSLADVTDSDGMKVQMEVQIFVDEREWWLWEYRAQTPTDRLIYRSLAGRTYDQMQTYIAEVRDMVNTIRPHDAAEAARLEARVAELSKTKMSRNTAGTMTILDEGKPSEKTQK